MTAVRLERVSKRFGTTIAVHNVSLEVASGELFFLLGPSGCGKTTLLRLIAGFLEPDEGEIYFDDRPMRHVPVQRRDLGIVFQHYALWPHRSVFENIAYGLEVRRFPRGEIQRRVQEILQLMRLEAYRDRYPGQLSGGQQQRVAMARALVIRPRVLLLDEPLSNLDAALRQELREEIRRIQREIHITAIYVTHDQGEALSMADHLAVMHQGRILQVGSPREVYERPTSRFVATFLGQGNLFPCRLLCQENSVAQIETTFGAWRAHTQLPHHATGQPLYCLVRAEHWQLANEQSPNRLEAVVKRIDFHGDVLLVELLASTHSLYWRVPTPLAPNLMPGHRLQLSAPPERIVLLSD
ncbi:MAG: ABC transporter ATP-binding protein [Gemmatales bacterium]|nr:ABC transporter ATP-binding protein [Gemmatales bacterium]MDW7995033.1 ABC transporter ATP-binding protein [Gemmatales bacterium]